MKRVEIFTDGSCYYQTRKGGCAALLRCNGSTRELSAGFSNTTNNRMELMAVILAVEALKQPCAITLTSDSLYIVEGVNNRRHAWARRGWRRSARMLVRVPSAGSGRSCAQDGPALVYNHDLWKRLHEALARHQVVATWIRGHVGHIENERCDTLAGEAYRNGPWTTDNNLDA